MQDFRIYLAGGMGKFGTENFECSDKWRRYCKKALEGCEAIYNVRVTNPNNYYNFKDEPKRYESEREIMEFDINRVKNSHLIICNFNDPTSMGTMAEIAIAYENRIPVIGLNEERHNLHPWQTEFCTKFFYDIDEMLDYIQDFYLL